MSDYVNVIGAGLAGCESAWQLAKRGIRVKLYEMKPKKYTEAHHSENYSELVCSNSLRSNQIENAVGLLKEELRIMGSLIIECADATRVPAGGALAVDRDGFSKLVTEKIKNHPLIEIISEEITELPLDNLTIVATGPLTSEALSKNIMNYVGQDYLHFFDASAPIMTLESINMLKAYRASRYGKGDDDYINCPLEKEEYEEFYNELINAELASSKEFESINVFEGCMPVEEMAKRGVDTLRFGPMKPVGLINPHTGKEPYAVVQLRQDNKDGTLYNIVGFQTRLKWPEQKRVFGLIGGLENAEFVRYGVMHRNTFLRSTELLDSTYRLKKNKNLFFAGQITGVEGYIESASSGFVAAINCAKVIKGEEMVLFPKITAIGALANYISDDTVKNFQPMNVNFGILEPLGKKVRDKKVKNLEIANRSLEFINSIATEI